MSLPLLGFFGSVVDFVVPDSVGEAAFMVAGGPLGRLVSKVPTYFVGQLGTWVHNKPRVNPRGLWKITKERGMCAASPGGSRATRSGSRPRRLQLRARNLVTWLHALAQGLQKRGTLRRLRSRRSGPTRANVHGSYAGMALDPITELEAVVDAFDAEGIGYALCGGLALAVHGYPRATKDIDILVEGADLEHALAVARRLGFDIPARRMTFGRRRGVPRVMHRASKLDPETGDLLPLDLLVVNPELEPVWQSRETVRTEDRRLTVVSRAGLVTMKKIAGRRQDIADLAKLEGQGDDDED